MNRSITRRAVVATAGVSVAAFATGPYPARAAGKQIAYLTPGLDLPFWRILAK
ncbi:MAG: hypothetical protein WA864_15740 [Acetobacteraceae bacterium]|jgi:ribose transport system substrate-binding protein